MAHASSFASRHSAPSSHRLTPHDDASSIVSEDASTSAAASSSSSFDTRSCHSEPSSSSLDPLASSVPRPRHNEHLAVLLPKRLWKVCPIPSIPPPIFVPIIPNRHLARDSHVRHSFAQPDSQAAHCDTFLCRKAFSIWERRHHCRKCGGVYCGECSVNSTPLLDTSKLSFLNPPRNIPIVVYDSPTSPVINSRVCNDCWDQIHGVKTPRSPVISQSHPIALVRNGESSSTASGSSSVSSSIATPPEGSPLNSLSSRPNIRRTHTSPRIPSSPLRAATPLSQSTSSHISDSELSLGELSTYPLKRASNICKATGGGRWEPKPIPDYVAKRIPGCKAAYELELEREEAERRLRRLNPVIKDGDFQLRCPREIEPCSPAGPFVLSTF
ncbi:FYVE zinc finger-domain-containing protein [Fomes fomentarius]|nr:FYVE zinc finger-domain-containing protein [Fomes fomentarius]